MSNKSDYGWLKSPINWNKEGHPDWAIWIYSDRVFFNASQSKRLPYAYMNYADSSIDIKVYRKVPQHSYYLSVLTERAHFFVGAEGTDYTTQVVNSVDDYANHYFFNILPDKHFALAQQWAEKLIVRILANGY